MSLPPALPLRSSVPRLALLVVAMLAVPRVGPALVVVQRQAHLQRHQQMQILLTAQQVRNSLELLARATQIEQELLFLLPSLHLAEKLEHPVPMGSMEQLAAIRSLELEPKRLPSRQPQLLRGDLGQRLTRSAEHLPETQLEAVQLALRRLLGSLEQVEPPDGLAQWPPSTPRSSILLCLLLWLPSEVAQ
jgi:hypothetical protein